MPIFRIDQFDIGRAHVTRLCAYLMPMMTTFNAGKNLGVNTSLATGIVQDVSQLLPGHCSVTGSTYFTGSWTRPH
jgi:hypothetical protein